MSSRSSRSPPVITKSSEQIRQQVRGRHWQLFETRLKNPLFEKTKVNYTQANNYRIVDRYKKLDKTQSPIQPDQRWQMFCSQLTNQTTETARLMSMFQNVWVTNWNTITPKQSKPTSTSNDSSFLNYFIRNERDKQVISSILHRAI